ncbi:signal peptidase I [Herbidospora daliensis]|uniref:signal peptidase I n=1 Tax=Herbidospora daliensis TaxID=295585 RepID=UPI000780951F|nr:signal peptidase I [Herbidospora daliensis]
MAVAEEETNASGKPEESGKPEKKKKSALRETITFTIGGIVVALLVHFFVMRSFWIPSESMENTLLVNDRVVVLQFGSIDRGDIVVFKGWDGEDTIKRVIGKGGDTVKCCDAQRRITVNGTPIEEEGKYLYPGDYAGRTFEVKVPAGRLWLMGDHRSNSMDSRSYIDDEFKGTISEDDVIGFAFARYWPLDRLTFISQPDTFSNVR